MEEKKDIVILGIESSCDETAASVVRNGREVLSNVISSQIALHTLYGGVVPEIASRKHIEKINVVIEEALAEAHMTLDDIGRHWRHLWSGPCGRSFSGRFRGKSHRLCKKSAFNRRPSHRRPHFSQLYRKQRPRPPFACLVVSGGHTHLVIVKDYGKYEIVGRTRDDAAGEAFDKVAGPSVSAIPAARRLIRFLKREIPTPSLFPGQKWQILPMISASAA